MSDDRGPSTGVIAGLAAGAVLLWAAILVLWLGTEPWTDYAAFAAGGLAFATILLSGFTWINESTTA